MRDIGRYDHLFALKAYQKFVDGKVKEVERECKAEFLDEYEKQGNDRVRSVAFGGKNAYMTVQEGKPSEDAERFDVIDVDALTDWMDEAKPYTDCFAQDNIAMFAEWYFNVTGEVPDGCRLLRYKTEPKPPIAKLTVKEGPVLEALRENPELAEGVRALLPGDAS